MAYNRNYQNFQAYRPREPSRFNPARWAVEDSDSDSDYDCCYDSDDDSQLSISLPSLQLPALPPRITPALPISSVFTRPIPTARPEPTPEPAFDDEERITRLLAHLIPEGLQDTEEPTDPQPTDQIYQSPGTPILPAVDLGVWVDQQNGQDLYQMVQDPFGSVPALAPAPLAPRITDIYAADPDDDMGLDSPIGSLSPISDDSTMPPTPSLAGVPIFPPSDDDYNDEDFSFGPPMDPLSDSEPVTTQVPLNLPLLCQILGRTMQTRDPVDQLTMRERNVIRLRYLIMGSAPTREQEQEQSRNEVQENQEGEGHEKGKGSA